MDEEEVKQDKDGPVHPPPPPPPPPDGPIEEP
jgi:hypothetical protein